MSKRSGELGARLDQLRDWAVREAFDIWTLVDPTDIIPSFRVAAPVLVQLHRAQAIEALTAVDLMMLCEAADAGFRAEPDWTLDFPDRPTITYWGQQDGAAILQAPVITLARIKAGKTLEAALLAGWHSLARIYKTEPYAIARQVGLARVQDDLRLRGA